MGTLFLQFFLYICIFLKIIYSPPEMNTSPYNGTVFVISQVLRSKRDPSWSLYSQWISERYRIWFEEILLNFFILKIL